MHPAWPKLPLAVMAQRVMATAIPIAAGRDINLFARIAGTTGMKASKSDVGAETIEETPAAAAARKAPRTRRLFHR